MLCSFYAKLHLTDSILITSLNGDLLVVSVHARRDCEGPSDRGLAYFTRGPPIRRS